jgi:molybdate transport system substrate-binding protein
MIVIFMIVISKTSVPALGRPISADTASDRWSGGSMSRPAAVMLGEPVASKMFAWIIVSPAYAGSEWSNRTDRTSPMMENIKLLSTTAMKTAIDTLVAAYERDSGRQLTAFYAPSAQIAARVAGGEPADVAITTCERIEELVREGHVDGKTCAPIARSRIGVAVRKGAPRPDLSSVDAFVRALLGAKSIAMSNPVGGGASGAHMWSVFERLGIAAALRPKTLFGPGGPAGLIGFYLLRGEAEIGLQQMSELMAVEGIDVVGPVPAEIQLVSVFTAGICARTKIPAAAQSLLDFLKTPAAAAALRSAGLEPA